MSENLDIVYFNSKVGMLSYQTVPKKILKKMIQTCANLAQVYTSGIYYINYSSSGEYYLDIRGEHIFGTIVFFRVKDNNKLDSLHSTEVQNILEQHYGIPIERDKVWSYCNGI